MTDGLIILDKPFGVSSAKALYRVRKLTGVRKSGHAGTLDPAATGVLILCLGKATKLVERLMDEPKEYVATGRLDVTSASFDAECPLEPVAVGAVPSRAELDAAAADFHGVIQQRPPALSAIKVGGRRAYKLARRGDAPKLAARPVRVDRLVVTRYAWPELEFELACGRGTYVRSLIRDLGERLGTGGCLTALRRTAVGPFRADEAVTVERLAGLAEAGEALSCVIPLGVAQERLAASAAGRGK